MQKLLVGMNIETILFADDRGEESVEIHPMFGLAEAQVLGYCPLQLGHVVVVVVVVAYTVARGPCFRRIPHHHGFHRHNLHDCAWAPPHGVYGAFVSSFPPLLGVMSACVEFGTVSTKIECSDLDVKRLNETPPLT